MLSLVNSTDNRFEKDLSHLEVRTILRKTEVVEGKDSVIFLKKVRNYFLESRDRRCWKLWWNR